MALAQRKNLLAEAEKTAKPFKARSIKGFSEQAAFCFQAQRWRLSLPFFAKEERMEWKGHLSVPFFTEEERNKKFTKEERNRQSTKRAT